jgi:succinyl-CoA synthetase beta subunit
VKTQARRLSLLEYQSKDLLARHGVNVQRFRTAGTLEDAARIVSEFHVAEYVIKAQVSCHLPNSLVARLQSDLQKKW